MNTCCLSGTSNGSVKWPICGAEYDAHTGALAAWIALMKDEREKMIGLVRETVQNGGSIFVGEKSLVSQLI